MFLAVARGGTKEKNEFSSSVLNRESQMLAKSLSDRSRRSQSSIKLEDNGLFFRHLLALFSKRSANFRKDKKAWVCTTILRSLFVLIGFIVYKFAGLNRDLGPVLLTLDDYNVDAPSPRNPIVFNSPDSIYSCQPGQCAYQFPLMNLTETNELYSYCGLRASLNTTEMCSITESGAIMNRINDTLASPTETAVATVNEVRLLISLAFVLKT